MRGAPMSGAVVNRHPGVTQCVFRPFELHGSLHSRQAAAIARATNGPGSEQSTLVSAVDEFTIRIIHNKSRIMVTAPHHTLETGHQETTEPLWSISEASCCTPSSQGPLQIVSQAMHL